MSSRRALSAACCLLASSADAFAPPAASVQRAAVPPASARRMSSVADDSYPALLSDASLCADSESCSIEYAEMYLNQIVLAQSGCAVGTVSGDVCDDVQAVSEVVAGLRKKIKDGAGMIQEGAEREVRSFWDQRQGELVALAAASQGGGLAALKAPVRPGYLAAAALLTCIVITVFQPASMDVGAAGTVPFSAQEAWWAVRDGYAGDMAHHLFRNGGLLVSDPSPIVGSSLSPQELMWSIRDGYADDTLFSSGGGGVAMVPFTPQELWVAFKNGYSYDMIAHWFRNGGLVV